MLHPVWGERTKKNVVSYLNNSDINVVLFKICHKFFEILPCWEIMSTVWPDSLDYAKRFEVIETKSKKKLVAGSVEL